MMKIGVISDSHDHVPNLRHALTALEEHGVRTVFHCGDLISPFISKILAGFDGEVHTVFGNNDGDRFLNERLAAGAVTHHGEFGFVDVGGHRVGFTHYEQYARGFLASGQCDVAFYGHSHVFAEERVNGALLLNPGELLGLKGLPAHCVYDCESRNFQRHEFSPQAWPTDGVL